MVTQNDPATADAAPPGVLKRMAVYGIVVGTVVLAVGLIAVTGMRWMSQPMPSSTIVVLGDASHVGATVIVTRQGEQQPRPAVRIEPRHNGHTPLFVESGTYLLRVEKDGRPIFHTAQPFYVAAGRIYDIDLATATTRPH